MSLRRRIGLLCAVAVSLTVLVASLITYAVVRGELHGQIDDALSRQAQLADRVAVGVTLPLPPGAAPRIDIPPPPAALGAPTAIQVIGVGGEVQRRPFASPQTVSIPVTSRDRSVAAGDGEAFFSDRKVGETRLRVLTSPVGTGGAVQLARSLNGTDDALARLRLVLIVLLLAGTLGGWLLGRLLAGRAIQPIAELTDAVEHVELTGDLSHAVTLADPLPQDEVGRLARRFNAMLTRLGRTQHELESSVEAQRRLVADASHELRTPVTSLRTNAEVLREQPDLPVDQRNEILDDVAAQADELGLLVGDLIELARDGEAPTSDEGEELRLDELVAEAVARGRRLAPAATFTLHAEPVVIEGHRERLSRAINNLLDNAVKHGPTGEQIDVRVLADGTLTVRDHGPSIPPADREHAFDRFWRGADARARPGSGLGLAIVHQVAVGHGGSVTVEDAPGGGALFRMTLPVAG